MGYVLRGVYVAVSIILNYILFFLVPIRAFNFLGQLTPNLEANITPYFLAIEVLTAIRVMLKDHILGAMASVSSGLVKALYIYIITQGGIITMSLSGYLVTVDFKPIVYLMIIPLLLDIVKQIYDLANKSSAKPITMIEVAAE